ncbi:MAG: hypothetical protein MI810_18250 [Flavobacteriales bacterium]|nr:hypothetical protein [Flavobacteriales bacterium]
MKLHEIESDGKKYIFHAIYNFTEPCPQCGVPACGKEDILWFEKEGKRKAIIFDGSYLDMAIEDTISANLDQLKKRTLPTFIVEWNVSKGWVDCWDYDGYDLSSSDFIESMKLIKSAQQDWMPSNQLEALEKLASEAKLEGLSLKIVRG